MSLCFNYQDKHIVIQIQYILKNSLHCINQSYGSLARPYITAMLHCFILFLVILSVPLSQTGGYPQCSKVFEFCFIFPCLGMEISFLKNLNSKLLIRKDNSKLSSLKLREVYLPCKHPTLTPENSIIFFQTSSGYSKQLSFLLFFFSVSHPLLVVVITQAGNE